LPEFPPPTGLPDFIHGLLSRPNFDLNHANLRRMGRAGRLEMEFQSFPQILEGLFLSPSLAGYIDLQTLGDIPIALTPHRR
jgi:hypothetical protein